MADYSFDVVSKVDLNVIAEAVSAANKEITNRYDFKGTNSTIELNQKDNELKLCQSGLPMLSGRALVLRVLFSWESSSMEIRHR